MSTMFLGPHRLRATSTRLARRLLPGLPARTSAAARVVACALASLLAVCASAPPAPVPVALAVPAPPVVYYWAYFNAAGVAPYLALTQPGASPSAGDANLRGVAQFGVDDAALSIRITLQFTSSLTPSGGSIQCRAATANGPVSRSRSLPPPTDGTIFDVWYADQATLVALRQGACYLVVNEPNYPNGAAAGQIVKFDQQTQALIEEVGDQLVAWWALDDGSGTTLGHALVGAQPGTLVGGATWTAGPKSSAERWAATGQSYAWQGGNPTWPCCLGNGPYAITPWAVSFTGSGTAQLPLTDLFPPAANQTQSLAFWLQVPSIPAIPRMALALTNPSVASGIKIGFLNGQFGAWRFGGGQLVAVAPPTPKVWRHVVSTFDGTSRHCLWWTRPAPVRRPRRRRPCRPRSRSDPRPVGANSWSAAWRTCGCTAG